MRLLYVRHGQTDYNKNKLPQRQEIDAPLNQTGIAQAEMLAGSLPATVELIISSPLSRSAQTAVILSQHLGVPIKYDDEIKEFSYGTLAGRPWPEIIQITSDPHAKEKDHELAFDYTRFGGESATAFKIRVANFVARLRSARPAETIVISTHGGVIDAMHILFPLEQRPLTSNASVHEFEFL